MHEHPILMISDTKNEAILVIGALGQIGQELTEALRKTYGVEKVVAADIRTPDHIDPPFVYLDVLDKSAIINIIQKHQIKIIFNLAAILSAKGEKDPQLAWKINMDGLLNTLDAAIHTDIRQIFWPSSIAVFGPDSPKTNTPQHTIMNPNTVYGISKLAGERWCEYYANKYGLDIRSLRYPGLIGYKSLAGGGTTDYAVDIFYAAVKEGTYTSFLSANTILPMMYMPDAIRATLSLMKAPRENILIRSSYNIGGISFSPAELTVAIQQYIPGFSCNYQPDFRQEIADSWPDKIDDTHARKDWDWQPEYDLHAMTKDMILHIQEKSQRNALSKA